jgi:hypothetical protein
MNAWVWRAALAGLCIWNFTRVRALLAAVMDALDKRAAESAAFTLAGAVFIAFFLLAHAPVIWNLPASYDVLEYHLAAPAEYLRAGSVSFLHENIYATMPENGEMLYLLAMLLAGGKIVGLPGAHTILFAAWGLTILGVYCLARRLERSLSGSGERSASPAPMAAALFFVLVPMGSELAADFYVEHFQALFHVAALLCGCAFLSDFKIRLLFKSHALHAPWAWIACAGIFGGLCCGTKYLALLFTLAPLAVFLPGYCLMAGTLRDAIGAALRLCVPAVVFFAPWLVRNAIAAGDPIFPLGVVLKRRHAGASGIPDKLDHFEAAHRAGEISWQTFRDAFWQLMPGLHEQYLREIECGPQLCLFAVPGLASVANAETAFVAFVFVADMLLWFFFSLHNSRFVFPYLAALAALGGAGVARVWGIAPLRKVATGLCCAAILLFAPLQLTWQWLMSSREGIAAADLKESVDAQFEGKPPNAYIGALVIGKLSPNARVLFIGEAQTFYCERTPAYSVVFNPSLLEAALHNTKSADEAAAYLRERGITHLYFNYLEWWRLDTTYALRLDDNARRWKLVQWDDAYLHNKWLKLQELIYTSQSYAAAWPEELFPAYLKLIPAEYERMDELLRMHTRVIWPPPPDSPQKPSVLELRELF